MSAKKLIRVPKAAGPETLRVIAPRALQFLYTMRGKRGIGHVGGDVEPNAIDLETMVRICDWIMCELIRVFHGLSLEDAQALVDSIATKQIPDIWEVAGKKRVLRRGLSYKQRVLLLLHSEADSAALSEDLLTWTEYPGMARFRQRVLGPMHAEKLVEYDRQAEIVYLSPLGVVEVEKNLLDRVANTS